MSAVEIISQIERLPAEEQQRVEEWLRKSHTAAFDRMCEEIDALNVADDLSEDEVIAMSLREKLR